MTDYRLIVPAVTLGIKSLMTDSSIKLNPHGGAFTEGGAYIEGGAFTESVLSVNVTSVTSINDGVFTEGGAYIEREAFTESVLSAFISDLDPKNVFEQFHRR